MFVFLDVSLATHIPGFLFPSASSMRGKLVGLHSVSFRTKGRMVVCGVSMQLAPFADYESVRRKSGGLLIVGKKKAPEEGRQDFVPGGNETHTHTHTHRSDRPCLQ